MMQENPSCILKQEAALKYKPKIYLYGNKR